jgi:hypothetical protein
MSRVSIDEILTLVPVTLQPICKALHTQILSVHASPDILIWPRLKIVSYGLGPRKMTDHYVYLAPQKVHVNLGFYQGKKLRSKDLALEGTGKNLRHIKIADVPTASSAAILKIVSATLNERRNALRGEKPGVN